MVLSSRLSALGCLLVLGCSTVLAEPVEEKIFPVLLDPGTPSIAERTELSDFLQPVANATRGKTSKFHRIAKKVSKSSRSLPCTPAKALKGKGRRSSNFSKRLDFQSVSSCVELSNGILKLTTRVSGKDSIVSWIPVALTDAPTSSIEATRWVVLDASPLLVLTLREASDPADGGVFEDFGILIVDPVRERYVARLNRSHVAEGGSDRGNFTESCEGVAEIRGSRLVAGGWACQEQAEDQTESGEVTSYTRSSGPDAELTYRYRDGAFVQEP